MRSAVCGLWRINSTAAIIKDSWLLMSCRMVESFVFKSATCSTVKVTGWLGKGMADNGLKAGEKASRFPGLPHLPVDNFWPLPMFHGLTKRERGP